MENNTSHNGHRDDEASRIGMWLFIFTELFLFACFSGIYRLQDKIPRRFSPRSPGIKCNYRYY